MFDPKYHISHKLLENIKKITVLVTDLNKQKFPKPVFLELERSAREISSYSSTSIEGNPLPLTDVKRILKHAPENIRDTEKEVLNYNHALEKLYNMKNYSFNTKLILDIHTEVMKDLLPKIKLGKLREEPVFVNDPKLKKTVYLPPDHKDANLLIVNLIEYIKKNTDRIDPVIIAGIFHKQFVIIHPFIDGNGRTVRLLTKVLLASMGLNIFHLFSFENYYNKNVTEYFKNVGVLGDYYDVYEKVDFTPWLEYFTDGIIDELLRVQKNIQKISLSPETELKLYHKKMIQYIEKKGYINDAQYSKLVERAKATRSLDFKKLINMGIIERYGKGKSTYYKLKTH